MKKIIKIGMTIATVLAMTTNILAKNFSDVPKGAWYEESINYLTSDEREVQVISGYTDGTFKPNETLTIEQFLVLVNRALGNEFDTSSEDVSWSEPYVGHALNNKWLTANDYKNQSDEISRELMSKILVSAVESVELLQYRNEEEIIKLIPDYNEVSNDYKKYVVKAYDTGLITGDEKGNFKGKDTLTRAESAIIVRRILDKGFRSPAELPKNETDLADTSHIHFDPVEDVNPHGAMELEKAQEYIIQAVENTRLFLEDGQAYVEITYPNLPDGYEWFFWVTVNHTDGLSEVITHINFDTDPTWIPNTGTIKEPLRKWTSVDTIKTADVRYVIESTEHKHNIYEDGRGADEGMGQLYQRSKLVNSKYNPTGAMENRLMIVYTNDYDGGTRQDVLEYDYTKLFEWWNSNGDIIQ